MMIEENKPEVPPVPVANNGNLKDLIEKNIKWSQAIYEQNEKIKRRITMMVVGSYLRLLLILVPLVLALIYLPPLLQQALSQYSELLGIGGNMSGLDKILSEVSPQDISQILKTIKK